ncbi:MAG: hypothetical protein JNM17_18145 [Archangium sp.]|nr:hypothetical protein [Archangium sp.]
MNVSGAAVGWILLLELVWLACIGGARAIADPLDPIACVDLAAAVALWPAIRVSFQWGAVRGLLAAQILLAYPVLEVMAHTGRCLTGHLSAIERALLIVFANGGALLVALVIATVTRLRTPAVHT